MIKKDIAYESDSVPNHVAIIMDGNGRWAKSKNKPRTFGHTKGSQQLEEIARLADAYGVKYLTVYAFSTENWMRPKEEVEYLMTLLRKFMKDSIKKSKKNNMRVRVIGDRETLDKDILKSIVTLEEASKDHTGLHLQIALNYGSRDEMIRAIRRISGDCVNGEYTPEAIDEACIEEHLDTYDIPDPDLLIRTSGEQRLSNFLLWQLAYTEFYFTTCFWPEFDEEEWIKAIKHYNSRERRFGGV